VQTPPGWYRDPQRPGTERWWDGATWTASVRPEVIPVAAGAPARGRRTRELGAMVAVLVVLVAVVVGAAVAHRGAPRDVLGATGPGPTATVPATGVDFVESSGTYSLRVGDDWDRVELPAGAAWYTGTGSRAFRDNVTVIVEDLPRRLSLDDYVDISSDNASRIGLQFDPKSRDDVLLSDGRTAVLLDYTSVQQGFTLRHRVVITVHDLVAVTATFTSEDDRFADSVRDVDAYLRTLNVR
jgi:hypothetical protein